VSERDFEIGARKFKLNKLDAFKQFHCTRRLAPLFGDLIPVAHKLSKLKPGESTDSQFESLTPIMNGLAKLSDADADYVLLTLCSAVEMQQQPIGNWARVATDAGLMFQDLDLSILLNIAARAFIYNMQSFFAFLPKKQPLVE
jgi:hypothetical protein